MIKLIWWIIKHIIWGGNLEADFSFLMSFTEAYEYLQRGYFIYSTVEHPKALYFMIGSYVYRFDAMKKKCELVGNFSTSTMKHSWKVLPLTEQVKLKNGE